MKLISITKATDGKHKYTALFADPKKTTHFGAAGANDYLIYSKQSKTIADEKRKLYLARHEKNEHWNDPTSAGALSKFLLWSEPTFKSALAKYKKHFNL